MFNGNHLLWKFFIEEQLEHSKKFSIYINTFNHQFEYFTI